jgi:hypothetical protein
VVHRIGQRLVAVKNVHEKDAPVLEEGLRNPYRQPDADAEIQQVSEDNDLAHGFSFRGCKQCRSVSRLRCRASTAAAALSL